MNISTRFLLNRNYSIFLVLFALIITTQISFSQTTATPCDTTAIKSSNESACSDNSIYSDITDDIFTADITVTFTDTPITGTLDLTGCGTATVSLVGLTSPHTFQDVLLGLILVGGPIAQLIPGQIFTATYQIAQADLDASIVINSATVSGEEPASYNEKLSDIRAQSTR